MSRQAGESAFLNAHVEQVIVAELDLIGNGTRESPYRRMKQILTLAGELIAEVDPLMPYYFDRCSSRWEPIRREQAGRSNE